jgi:ubiquitin fusion degradation protein 1
MEMDLNSRSAKWKREEEKRKQLAKRRIQAEQVKRKAAEKAQKELEDIQAQKRIQRLEEEALLDEQILEERRLTGGIKYLKQLKPVPTVYDGDKITLPVSALEELNPQHAFELGVFTFELSFQSKFVQTKVYKSHCGVLEFTAEENTVGLPPKVARSLFQEEFIDTIQVKFVRLEKGKFASLQPKGQGFGKREIDFKQILERSLSQVHTTLTVGDILFLRHGRETFEVQVTELKPENAVNILNTDLEVHLLPCEEIMQEKELQCQIEEAKQIALQAEQKAKELQTQQNAQKEEWKQKKINQLQPEPSLEQVKEQVKIQLRLPEGQYGVRRFALDSSLSLVFDFVEALTGDKDAKQLYQFVATFPRRLFDSSHANKTLKDLGLNGRQESLFVEKLATTTINTTITTTNTTARTTVDSHPDLSSPPASPTVVLSFESTSTSPSLTLSLEWLQAKEKLEKMLDDSLNAVHVTPIHAVEPAMPIIKGTNDAETKWQVQLQELQAMGFTNTPLNIEILERYQGRMLRVVNYLSELTSAE